MRLKLYSDQAYLPPGMGHVPLLCPFWGNNAGDSNDPDYDRDLRYTEIGAAFFQMTSLEEADFAVVPGCWNWMVEDAAGRELAFRFVRRAEQAGKRLLLFVWSDSYEDVPVPNAVVFRASMLRSLRKPNEFAFPPWTSDFVEKYLEGELAIRRKQPRPVVGFCGMAGLPPVAPPRTLRANLRHWAGRAGLKAQPSAAAEPVYSVRARALGLLSKSAAVQTNFKVRDSFFGGIILPDGKWDLGAAQDARREYVRNMVESDYVVCARGEGNFSYRLYETLCCGRIPVFIDTDCVLPYDFAVDWKRYCVWVDARELPQIAEKVAAFHDALTDWDFVSLQRECRTFWEQWLSQVGFFGNFYRHFQADAVADAVVATRAG